mmetsp:Transcript_6165/g.11635  ORF Transcript_6165/g.11635 Transcript_6165/m.11635 type:complete len:372 (-) Transcript_6165:819-1934(-)
MSCATSLLSVSPVLENMHYYIRTFWAGSTWLLAHSCLETIAASEHELFFDLCLTRVCNKALFYTVVELWNTQVLANEHEGAFPFLARFPGLGHFTSEKHVHGLEREFEPRAMNCNHSLASIQIFAFFLQQLSHECVELSHVELAFYVETDRGNRSIMLGFLVEVHKLFSGLQDAVEGKALYAHDFIQVDLRVFRLDHLCSLVQLAYLLLHALHFLLINQVGLVQEDDVCKRHLLHSLISALLLLADSLHDPFTVDHSHNAVDSESFGNVIVSEEGLRDRRRGSHPRGLDDDAVEVLAFRDHACNLLEGVDEIHTHRAADASVLHQVDILFILELVRDELVVDADAPKLVFDHGVFFLALLLQDVVEQRGLP